MKMKFLQKKMAKHHFLEYCWLFIVCACRVSVYGLVSGLLDF